MEDYCCQDTLVTAKLWWALDPDSHNQKSIEFEHSIAEICDEIGNAGWVLNIEKATQLYTQLKEAFQFYEFHQELSLMLLLDCIRVDRLDRIFHPTPVEEN